MKLLERVIENRIRLVVDPLIGEEQQGFRKGRGTMDGMFVIRQMVKKEARKNKRWLLVL